MKLNCWQVGRLLLMQTSVTLLFVKSMAVILQLYSNLLNEVEVSFNSSQKFMAAMV